MKKIDSLMSPEQAIKFAAAVVNSIPSDLFAEDVEYCIKNPGVLCGFGEVISKSIRRKAKFYKFEVYTDYNRTLTEMIDAGKYDNFNLDINDDSFPTP